MESPLCSKSSSFADRILDMSDYLLGSTSVSQQISNPVRQNTELLKCSNTEVLRYSKVPYSVEVCVKQCARSGTSIGANVAEGQGVQSKADLVAKLSIAYKEAKETEYWLERLRNRKVLTVEMFTSMNNDLQEILRLLISSLNTLKNNKN